MSVNLASSDVQGVVAGGSSPLAMRRPMADRTNLPNITITPQPKVRARSSPLRKSFTPDLAEEFTLSQSRSQEVKLTSSHDTVEWNPYDMNDAGPRSSPLLTPPLSDSSPRNSFQLLQSSPSSRDKTFEVSTDLQQALADADRVLKKSEDDLNISTTLGKTLVEQNLILRHRHEHLLEKVQQLDTVRAGAFAGSQSEFDDANSNCLQEGQQVIDTPLTALPTRLNNQLGFAKLFRTEREEGLVEYNYNDSIEISSTSVSPSRSREATISPVPKPLAKSGDTYVLSDQVQNLTDQNNVLLGQLKTIADDAGAIEKNNRKKVRQLEKEIQHLRLELQEVDQKTDIRSSEELSATFQTDSTDREVVLYTQIGSASSQPNCSKRESYASVFSDSSSTCGSQMTLNTSTSSAGGVLISALVEKVNELEEANKTILEERDNLEQRVKRAEKEYERMKLDLEDAEVLANNLIKRHENSPPPRLDLLTLKRTPFSRSLSAEEAVTLVKFGGDGESFESAGAAAGRGALSPYALPRRGQILLNTPSRPRPSSRANTEYNRTNRDVHAANAHTRTLSLVEKMNKQRMKDHDIVHSKGTFTTKEISHDDLVPLEVEETHVSGGMGWASRHSTSSESIDRKLYEASESSSQTTRDDEFLQSLNDDSRRTVIVQESVWTRRMRQLYRVRDEIRSGTAAFGLTPSKKVNHKESAPDYSYPTSKSRRGTDGGHLKDKRKKRESLGAHLLALIPRPMALPLVPSESAKEAVLDEDPRDRKLRLLPHNDYLTSLEPFLAPITSVTRSIQNIESKVVAVFVTCFVWVQFVGYLLVAMTVTMYKGPQAAGLAQRRSTAKRLESGRHSRSGSSDDFTENESMLIRCPNNSTMERQSRSEKSSTQDRRRERHISRRRRPQNTDPL